MSRAWIAARGLALAVRGLARKPLHLLTAVAVAAILTLGTVVTVWSVRHALAVNRLASGVGDVIFYGADGRPWFRLDERRRDVPLAAIAPWLQQAILATEDRRFYWHPGIDPVGLARAVFVNARSGEMREGASTLTQQLARTLFLSNRRTLGRKAQEAVLAVMLEVRLSKAQILELYLNRVYLSAGLYGVEAMSQGAFGKRARDLTLAESVLIAGLVQAPSALSPWSNLDGARRRSDTVLARMVATGDITAAQARSARAARLTIRPYPSSLESRHGYAKEFLRQQFRDRFGGDQPPDWEVHTTLQPRLQDAAEQAVTEGLARLGIGGLQAALVALDPATGNVLAVVGGRDFRQSQFNRATRSRRQPGSAFKPFVYAVALEQGLSPVTELTGLASMAPLGKEEWTPRNVSTRVEDHLTLRQAFVESNNRAAVALQQKVGARAILALAGHTGLANQPNVPSLALGSGLVTPMGLTAAYAAFANGGDARASTGHPARAGPGRRRRAGRAGGTRARAVVGGRLPDDVADARRDRAWHGLVGAAMGSASAGGGQDRQHQRVQGRVVRRLFPEDRRRRVGGFRPAGDHRPGRLWRAHRGSDLGRLHEASRPHPGRRARSRSRPRSRPTSCAASRTSSRWMGVRSTPNTSRRLIPSRDSIARCTRARCASAHSVPPNRW